MLTSDFQQNLNCFCNNYHKSSHNVWWYWIWRRHFCLHPPLANRRITSLLLGLHLDAGVCDSANLQRSTWADIARFVSPGFPIQPPRSNSHRIKLCPCRHLDAHLASNRCISGGEGADMSYGNFNRATLLIYRGSSMKANYLESWRRTEISAGIGITRSPDRYLTSNLCYIDSHVSEVSQEKWRRHSESISNSGLRSAEGKFPMIDMGPKRG